MVWGTTGERADYRDWIVIAYENREDAEKHIDLANKFASYTDYYCVPLDLFIKYENENCNYC